MRVSLALAERWYGKMPSPSMALIQGSDVGDAKVRGRAFCVAWLGGGTVLLELEVFE